MTGVSPPHPVLVRESAVCFFESCEFSNIVLERRKPGHAQEIMLYGGNRFVSNMRLGGGVALWQVVCLYGVGGKLLRAMQSLYEDNRMCEKGGRRESGLSLK